MSAFQQLLDGNKGLVIHNPDEAVENDGVIPPSGSRFDAYSDPKRVPPPAPVPKMDNDHSVKPTGRSVEQRLTDVEQWMKETKETLKEIPDMRDTLNEIKARLPKQ